MKLYSLFLVLGFLALLILGTVVFLWRFAQVSTPQIYTTKTDSSVLSYAYKQTNSWFEKVAMFAKKDYVLPTNLMLIKMDNNSEFGESKGSFEIILDRCDFYSVFCITRVAKEFGVDATIVKRGLDSLIYLNTADQKRAQNIVLNLKKYNIHSKIKED
ncbi:hypothetical protein CIG2463D_1408 [Campylobacter iguaniorum]|uniref:Periplasmic protein n=1 Tax=Campylobacter iguaniorum TaxID=1244531 RepID=A0A076FBM7_9BACT|nr:hypothetical protein CIG1485E_1275 [Campylobacter iguaniorum]ALV24975.1 hypothetical protein CIG2463D_1408 [Campylobacter iguaniorum]